jgi:hypothetical protein
MDIRVKTSGSVFFPKYFKNWKVEAFRKAHKEGKIEFETVYQFCSNKLKPVVKIKAKEE